MKLRLGFIGVGAMGRSHVELFLKQGGDRVEVAAVCDRSDENLARTLQLAPSAQAFKVESELIRSDIDAVVVSTPNFTHLPLAREIVAAGKHLFLEKPCGVTREECAEMIQLADRTDKVLMIDHELRYSPFFQQIKALVDAGEIGRPRMVWTREFRGPFQPKAGNWIQNKRLSGGMLVDKNCHHFDMMNWWVGARPRRVSAFGGLAVSRIIEGPDQVNDYSTVSFEYDNGVVGTLHICLFARDFPHEDLEMGIVGETGMLQTRVSAIEILQWKRGSGTNDPIVHKVAARPGEGWGGHLGFAETHDAFLDAALEGKRPLTTVRDCVDGTLLALAAEESIKREGVVELGN